MIERKIKIDEQGSGLKGQKILAQGKRSVALGLEAEKKIVRPARLGWSGGTESFLKAGSIFRTKWIIPCFRTNVLHLSVRTRTFSLDNVGSRTANFNVHAIPGRRSSLTCPGLEYFGPSGRKISNFTTESKTQTK